jgi:hypothetical protein
LIPKANGLDKSARKFAVRLLPKQQQAVQHLPDLRV